MTPPRYAKRADPKRYARATAGYSLTRADDPPTRHNRILPSNVASSDQREKEREDEFLFLLFGKVELTKLTKWRIYLTKINVILSLLLRFSPWIYITGQHSPWLWIFPFFLADRKRYRFCSSYLFLSLLFFIFFIFRLSDWIREGKCLSNLINLLPLFYFRFQLTSHVDS